MPNGWVSNSDINGNYLIKLDTAINNTWSCAINSLYGNVNPPNYSLTPTTLGLVSGNFDFGIHFIPNVKDLEVVLGSSPVRPGFITNLSLSANNVGTVNQSNIILKFKKPNGYNVVSISIAPNSTINDTLIWSNVSLNYLNGKTYNVQLQVPAGAVLGSDVVYEAWVSGISSDTTPLNNYTKWTETVRGSFDPNDKLVNKSTLASNYDPEKDRLIYTIRFQNTGTDTAFTVIVRDEVPSNLDISSLRVVNASHPYQLIVREKNIVEVAFPNIQLPDSATNEAKSHGFVQLSFKPKAGLSVNEKIQNNASIIFDYNSPVFTNYAETVVKVITGISNNKKLDFKLYPNPTNGNIHVELPYSGIGNWILSDIRGRKIKGGNVEGNSKTMELQLGDIPSGTYLFTLNLGGQISSAKVMVLK